MEFLFTEGVRPWTEQPTCAADLSTRDRALMSRDRSGLAETKCSCSLGFCWFGVLGSQGAVLSPGDMVVPLDTVMR